jgi:hypothetical protein
VTTPPLDIPTIALLIDSAAGEPTRTKADQVVLSQLPPLLADLTAEEFSEAGWNDVQRAASWAFGYRIQHTAAGGRGRVMLRPYFSASFGEQMPPPVEAVAAEVVDVWESLSEVVTAAYGSARLEHVLFVAGRGNGFARATAAAESYLECAGGWSREFDRVGDLQTALALARAVGNHPLRHRIIDLVLDRAQAVLTPTDGTVGAILGNLELLDGERDVPKRYEELLDAALTRLTDPRAVERVHMLRRNRAADAETIAAIDAARVRVWMEAGAQADALVRSAHLKQALSIAEASGRPELVEVAAAALQAIPRDELGLMTFSASTSIAREDIERMVAPITEAPTWREALFEFTFFGPGTGYADDNRASAAEQARQFVFASLPREILGGDGLPRFMANSAESEAEMALTEQETFRLQTFAPILAYALSEVRSKHGIPTVDDLSAYFAERPGISDGLAGAMARVLQRYWTGDVEGAAFTAAPRIETITRQLVVALNAGVYRLQRNQRPGQYPGLGVLLGVLRERRLDDSWYRYIYTVTCNPAGMNLRNELSHGFVDNLGTPLAATLIQVMLFLSGLSPEAAGAPPPSEEDLATPDTPTESATVSAEVPNP